MSSSGNILYIATRGSALALAQANMVLAQCRAACPDQRFELKVIKTTGDKLQTASMAQEGKVLPKGLFTKELEVALLNNEAALAVHSLKDLPTELPVGLKLGAVTRREDVRDVLLYRDSRHQATRIANMRGFEPGLTIQALPGAAVVATSSTRRKAQILAIHPKVILPDIRGNVATRMQKLANNPEMDCTVLALAGMSRLNYRIEPDGTILGKDVPPGLLGVILDLECMLPCVGQGAIGIEIRDGDSQLETLCSHLNHEDTHLCVLAERAFLAGMGGGCQSPVAAHAQVADGTIRMRAVSFASEPVRRAELAASSSEPIQLGQRMAAELKPGHAI